jgi:hypothetical protein
MEKDKKISYLDVEINRNDDGLLDTKWYMKPIATGRLVNFKSNHHIQQKLNSAKGLIHRVFNLSSGNNFIDNRNTITIILLKNGYHKSLINRIISL